MTVVSNDPSWWPLISFNVYFSYWTVAAAVVVVYDLVLTLGQEIELIWRQRWSLMTVLYLVIRYIGMPFCVIEVLANMTTVPLTDAGCNNIFYAVNGINVVITGMLCVIMIARLYAMYQGSRRMLILLVIIFLAVNIACAVIVIIALKHFVAEEWIISGTYMCNFTVEGDAQLLISMTWILNTVWEVLALCFSVWITVKHFRDLRRLSPSKGSTIRDCFKVLIQSHVLYFASVVVVSCLQLAYLSPDFSNSNSVGAQILVGAVQILSAIQLFVLGPRLILSVREYHAKIVKNSDAETSMTSIAFQGRVLVSTSSTV